MHFNRLLTLPSGWRIRFGDNVNFIFETHDLIHASPATISRMGIVSLRYTTFISIEFFQPWNLCVPNIHSIIQSFWFQVHLIYPNKSFSMHGVFCNRIRIAMGHSFNNMSLKRSIGCKRNRLKYRKSEIYAISWSTRLVFDWRRNSAFDLFIVCPMHWMQHIKMNLPQRYEIFWFHSIFIFAL